MSTTFRLRGRQFLTGASGLVDSILGGWSFSGLVRLQGGQPYISIITDTNRLGGVNRSIRLDLVPGVPIKDPLFSYDNCSMGSV